MKILIVGGTGTIGKKVAAALQGDHEVITAGSKSGDLQLDITSTESIEAFFKKAGKFDALISATGSGYFGPLKTMTLAYFKKGLDSKLSGQVNLVLIGQKYINPKGSFTLTSGILSDDPIPNGSAVSAVNGALNSFVIGAAIELENGVRINVVSPGLVEDSMQMLGAFPGHFPVTMDRVVAGYVKSVLGGITGQVIKVQ
ncbi:MAG: short chain dehydrogenase [Mucilaginibacter sp.]